MSPAQVFGRRQSRSHAFCRTRNWITSTAAHRRTREAVRMGAAIRSTSSQGIRTTDRATTPSDAIDSFGSTCFECSTSDHSKLARRDGSLGTMIGLVLTGILQIKVARAPVAQVVAR
jgi:hypothetical protein